MVADCDWAGLHIGRVVISAFDVQHNLITKDNGPMKNAILITFLLMVTASGCLTPTPAARQTQMLQDAALLGNLAGVKESLDNGADISSKDDLGWTPLMRAVSGGHVEVVKLLLAKGAAVNVRCENGVTPLMVAVALDNMEVITILVDKGADINAKAKDKSTPLRMAVSKGYNEVAQFLVSHGAEL